MKKITDDVKALLFDMDGTVIDSMWIWDDIDREYLGNWTIEEIRAFQKQIEGMSFTETCEYMKVHFSLPDSLDQIKQKLIDMAEERYINKVTCKPGIIPFLKEMQRQGKKMAIATSNARELAEATLLAREIRTYFDLVLTACDVKKGKPSPDIYLEAARTLGVDPGECLVFEDVPMGVRAGKNAGMAVCAMEDRFALDQKDTIRDLADYYISDFNQILEGTQEVLR